MPWTLKASDIVRIAVASSVAIALEIFVVVRYRKEHGILSFDWLFLAAIAPVKRCLLRLLQYGVNTAQSKLFFRSPH